MRPYVKLLKGRRSLSSKVIVRTHRHTHSADQLLYLATAVKIGKNHLSGTGMVEHERVCQPYLVDSFGGHGSVLIVLTG